MGRIATGVLDKDASDTLKVSEGSNNNEYMITKHSQFEVPINVINIYGEQEGRVSKDEVFEKWQNVRK